MWKMWILFALLYLKGRIAKHSVKMISILRKMCKKVNRVKSPLERRTLRLKYKKSLFVGAVKMWKRFLPYRIL